MKHCCGGRCSGAGHLATVCPNCNYRIPPAELRCVSSTQMRCPKCAVPFTTSACLNCETDAHGGHAATAQET
jgi:hypothetical protein